MNRIPQNIYDHEGNAWHLVDYSPDETYSLVYESRNEYKALTPKEIETEFTKHNRKAPMQQIVQQGPWECSAASLAMLLNEKLFFAKRALGKVGWTNCDKGATPEMIIEAAAYLGKKLKLLSIEKIDENIGPCLVTVKSLNYPSKSHMVTWTGREILDPNWGRQNRKWWGTEWAPWTMRAKNVYILEGDVG